MIIPASNNIIVKIFNQVSKQKVNVVTNREFYDNSLYSMLEFISFDNKPDRFVLKTLKRPLKHEILVHKFVNDYSINGSKFIAGYTSDFFNLHFILMEYIKDIEPIYQYDDSEVIDYYYELAQHLAYFHVQSRKSLDKIKNSVTEFSYLYYINLLEKFNEKLPMLSKKINHELYLTSDIIEKFLNTIETLSKQILKTTDLKRSLVHGDFDLGNIFLKPIDKDQKQIIAIDWGLSHIDLPLVDMANLLYSLKNLSENNRDAILKSYLRIAKKEFPKNYSLNDFESIGMILHYLFFIEFQLNTLETSSTNIDEYYEQIHRAIESLIELSDNTD